VTATLPKSKLQPAIETLEIWERDKDGLPARLLSPHEIAQGVHAKLEEAWEPARQLHPPERPL